MFMAQRNTQVVAFPGNLFTYYMGIKNREV